MKRLTLFTLGLLMGVMTQAQTTIGLRGHFGSTFILNKNIADAGKDLDYKGSYAGGFGLHVIQMLGTQSGIALGVGQSTFKQQTQGEFEFFGVKENYVNQFKMKYTDVNLLYTYRATGGLFIEVGPQFSFRNSEIEEISNFDMENEVTESFDDNNLNETMFSAVFGIGGMINLSEEFNLGVGLRLQYGFSDLTQELGESAIEDLDPESTSLYTDVSQGEDIDDETFETTYDYRTSNPVSATFNIGLYYNIP